MEQNQEQEQDEEQESEVVEEVIDFTNIPFEDNDNYNFFEGFYKTILLVLFS